MYARQRFPNAPTNPGEANQIERNQLKADRRRFGKLPLIVLVVFLVTLFLVSFSLILRNAKVQIPNTPKHTYPTSDGLSDCNSLDRHELTYPDDNFINRVDFYKPFLFRTEVKFAHWDTYRLPWAENGTIFEEPTIHVFSPSIIRRSSSEYLVFGRHTPINLCNWTWGPWHHQHIERLKPLV